MTQENKELLIQDLCARLPYGVKMNHIADNEHSPKTLIGIAKDMITLKGLGGYECVDVEHYKPYLFPLSVMTEEQEQEWDDLYIKPLCERLNPHTRKEDLMLRAKAGYAATFWLIKNHFDYLGLIPMGLANDATGLNIY